MNPVLLDKQVISEPTLVGRWVDKDGMKVTVEPEDSTKSYPVTLVEKDGKESKYLVRFGKVDALLLVESRPVKLESNSEAYQAQFLPLYSFWRYEKVSPDRISICTIEQSWLEQTVKAHPEELKVDYRQGDDAPLILSPTENLQAFLKKHAQDKDVFGEKGVFHKQK